MNTVSERSQARNRPSAHILAVTSIPPSTPRRAGAEESSLSPPASRSVDFSRCKMARWAS